MMLTRQPCNAAWKDELHPGNWLQKPSIIHAKLAANGSQGLSSLILQSLRIVRIT